MCEMPYSTQHSLFILSPRLALFLSPSPSLSHGVTPTHLCISPHHNPYFSPDPNLLPHPQPHPTPYLLTLTPLLTSLPLPSLHLYPPTPHTHRQPTSRAALGSALESYRSKIHLSNPVSTFLIIDSHTPSLLSSSNSHLISPSSYFLPSAHLLSLPSIPSTLPYLSSLSSPSVSSPAVLAYVVS
jgi:hypothetical protein